MNLVDSWNIKFFLQFPWGSILKFSWWWNCVGCTFICGCFILKAPTVLILSRWLSSCIKWKVFQFTYALWAPVIFNFLSVFHTELFVAFSRGTVMGHDSWATKDFESFADLLIYTYMKIWRGMSTYPNAHAKVKQLILNVDFQIVKNPKKSRNKTY